MKHVLCILALWAAGLGSALLANNIAVSNVTTTGQNTSAGVNNAANYTDVKFDLSWENSWRYNSTSGGLSYIALKTRGSNYTGTPNVFIGSQGSVAWQASTAVTAGSFLVVSGTPNRYYRVTSNHTTGATAPTHTTGTTANLEFVSVSDGGGSGATATASVSSGFITGFTITAAGSGYTSLPSIHIFPTNGGSEATADVHISSWWDAAWVFVKFRVGASNPTFTGVSSSGTTVTVSSTANLRVGMPVRVTGGTGAFNVSYNVHGGDWSGNSPTQPVITSIINSTQFTISNTPTTALSGASIECLRIWEHAILSATAGDHTVPAVATLDAPSDGAGVFIYRNANGTGTFSLSDVKLRWVYGANGVPDDAVVQVQVFAKEMVWVPQGSFYVGSGGTETGSFTNGSWVSGNTIPFQITSESALGIDNVAGKLWGTSSSGNTTIGNAPGDAEATLPAAFPKGYAGFYCMKYELSQGDYRDFLNTLTYFQQRRRTEVVPDTTPGIGALRLSNSSRSIIDIQTSGSRNSYTPAVYACNQDGDGNYNETHDGEWVACNFLGWNDGCAYLDWAGLRPMTELEYEKACRGVQAPVADEFAWGGTGLGTTLYAISNAAETSESISSNYNQTGNGHYWLTDYQPSPVAAARLWPLRVGIFAANVSNTGRASAGASYYGIMELSGNVGEPVVSVSNQGGRNFTGLNGDGQLSAHGDANQGNWPSGTITNNGWGVRGGHHGFASVNGHLRCSNRTYGGGGLSGERAERYGCRGVRVFP